MENTVPVSDMRNYNQTLKSVERGTQVILTKNGMAKYAVVDIDEWRNIQATVRLLEELQKGYHSLKTEETYSASEFAELLEEDSD
ncbi:type II toxin-antitoxin system prevent-host-death family antitoxin [Streptococcus panodentis]|uniref:Prevent-host-death protein n=1 Tax=Streptococcus panodentis TaxID=1581472 RepID=A0ABS5B0B4_9STRE|nr:type II toxin-antitoxin system prevent-host-death family antitoxin [Streptococcus panodentis]MBP2622276.1 prevent-host-death protein [Streptococcus panodentis]